MKKSHWLFVLTISILLIACQSKEKKKKEELENNLNTTWTLLSVAANAAETELSVPFGFQLNCTEDEYQKNCDALIKMYEGEKTSAFHYINADLLGTGKQKISISNFHYFSDPNTETDIVDNINFIFEDSRSNSSKDFLDRIIKAIDSKLSTGWEVASFTLDENEYSRDDFKKYWIKNNMAIELDASYTHISLAFYNIPKYGVKFFKDDVNMVLRIKEDVRKNLEEQQNLPKIENSTWDGSVWQAKKYIKNNLKDPDSYEGIEWSPVQETNDGYIVRHKFRAKNSFGGYAIEEYIITLNKKGNVVSAIKTD